MSSLILALRVWKQVHAACIEKSEFRLAQICGLNIVVHAVSLQTLKFVTNLIVFVHLTGGAISIESNVRATGTL